MFQAFRWQSQFVCIFGLLVSFTILAEDAPQEATKKPAEAKAAEENAEVDRYRLPTGTPAELLEFVESLKKYRPTSRADAMQHQRRASAVIREAAEKILELETDITSKIYRAAKLILLGTQLRGLSSATHEARVAFHKEVGLAMGSAPWQMEQLHLGMQTARLLEYTDETELAISLYSKLSLGMAESSIPEIQDQAEMLRGAVRRLELPGKALELEGETMAGKPFDLKQLKGKVVLVDFWATWCGPCLAEIPNMKKLHAAYHDKGFEIVGLSIDQDRQALEDFLEERQLPWTETVLHDKAHEGEHRAMKYYGISGIPAMILVGKDGKVIDIHARGEKLVTLLEKEFGPLPEEKPEAPKTDLPEASK